MPNETSELMAAVAIIQQARKHVAYAVNSGSAHATKILPLMDEWLTKHGPLPGTKCEGNLCTGSGCRWPECHCESVTSDIERRQ